MRNKQKAFDWLLEHIGSDVDDTLLLRRDYTGRISDAHAPVPTGPRSQVSAVEVQAHTFVSAQQP